MFRVYGLGIRSSKIYTLNTEFRNPKPCSGWRWGGWELAWASVWFAVKELKLSAIGVILGVLGFRVIFGLYLDNGKENGSYCSGFRV